MNGRPYKEILKDDAGYSEEILAEMTDEDCKAEYIEISMSGE